MFTRLSSPQADFYEMIFFMEIILSFGDNHYLVALKAFTVFFKLFAVTIVFLLKMNFCVFKEIKDK